MAQRHWLDPLARRLLIAAGQIAAPTPAATPGQAAAEAEAQAEALAEAAIERDLLALKIRQNPSLAFRDAAEVCHAAALGWLLDVNRATATDWLRLPGCSQDQVDLLLRLQAGGVQLSGPEDLQRVLDLDGERIRCWQPVLLFQWYAEPPAGTRRAPLDLNRAAAGELEEVLSLSPERCRRLLQERGRAPFRDLADLQERLQLPPAVVEAWIGRVGFGALGERPQPPAGPTLPPARPRRS